VSCLICKYALPQRGRSRKSCRVSGPFAQIKVKSVKRSYRKSPLTYAAYFSHLSAQRSNGFVGCCLRIHWTCNGKGEQIYKKTIPHRPEQSLGPPSGWGWLRQSTYDCGKVVGPTHRSPLPPRKYPWYSVLLRGLGDLGAILRPEGFSIK